MEHAHAPKTDEDYKIWMNCVKDYIVFLENWIEENRVAREDAKPHGLTAATGHPVDVVSI